ncbi:RNA polymerase subunit sigma [Echinicola strongylocentroti]|uniref:RNA polymerase sigma factor n=1 Tax=Echinicola strongylocentroti TaxID=1795355 RepID=A0A2Z4IG80_9BACT|nr:sigma-70 family RNA polymerase sigma factor [Echinicola strongylocentroti]AWW29690.1 RNA polymerase subunit sigma [Echinicola strongylocentroti]
MEKSPSDARQTVAEWVYHFGDNLFSWAFHKTNDRKLAEDLVQDTFLSALKSFASFEEKSSPQTWLFSILNNKIIDHYRKSTNKETGDLHYHHCIKITDGLFDNNGNWTKNGLEQAWEQEEHLLDNPEFRQVMDSCLNDLPENWHHALVSKFHLQKKTAEICQELGVSTSNYWQIIHRSKLLLKKCLEKKWFSTFK